MLFHTEVRLLSSEPASAGAGPRIIAKAGVHVLTGLLLSCPLVQRIVLAQHRSPSVRVIRPHRVIPVGQVLKHLLHVLGSVLLKRLNVYVLLLGRARIQLRHHFSNLGHQVAGGTDDNRSSSLIRNGQDASFLSRPVTTGGLSAPASAKELKAIASIII